MALATAAQVLENHSKLRVKPERSQSTTSDVPANYKVIKSSSDAQLSRNSSESILSLCHLSVECSQRGKGSPQAPTQIFCGMIQNRNPQGRGLQPARWLSLPSLPLIAALFPLSLPCSGIHTSHVLWAWAGLNVPVNEFTNGPPPQAWEWPPT